MIPLHLRVFISDKLEICFCWHQLLIPLITFTVIGVVPLLVWLASEGTQKNAIQNSKSQSDTATKLRELKQLHKEGIITKKEFSEAKKKYLK